MNNMLTAITGNLYLARHGKAGDDVVEKLEAAEKQSFAAAEMIDQLLTFSKQGMVDLQALPMDSFLEEAVRLVSVSLPDEIQLDTRVEATELLVHGDATMLREVLHSVIDNARDAVAEIEHPMITVGLERWRADDKFIEAHEGAREGEYAHIWISDNGCGIREDHLDHIFEPFFTTKPVGQGSGLGLAMSFGAVQTHGGFMDIDSAIGCGTSVHIYIPLIRGLERSADQPDD
jgi:signal transduction histidine kinase